MSAQPPEETIIIKRYSNRRLYDTLNSRYVNMQKLAEIVKDGNRLQVIDTTTGDDITKTILTQIILDNEKDQKDGLPLDLLFQLVKRGGSSYMGVMEDLLSIGPKAYEKTIDKVKSTLSPKPAKEDSTSTNDEINELKRRLADLENKIGAANEDN